MRPVNEDGRRELLQRQLSIAWGFAEQFVVGKVDEGLALWEPSSNVCTVHRQTNGWRANWPDEEHSPTPNVTAGWVLWHIEWWWSNTLALVGGADATPPETYLSSGGTDRIQVLKAAWDQVLLERDLDDVVTWPGPTPQPLWFVASWVTFELTKNLAEINALAMSRLNRTAT